MARDMNSLIQKGLDLLEDVLEVVAEVRERVESADEQHRGTPKRIVSNEVEATGEDISVLSSEELHARLLIALTEMADVGEELARRAEQSGR
jgi:hypothetical protein